MGMLLVICMAFFSESGEVRRAIVNTPYTSGGSFAIAVVCDDEILIGADSRGTIRDSTGRELAYWDGVQKVFPIGKAALAYTGLETIQNIYFGAIINAFTQTVSDDIPLENIIPKFLDYTDATFPNEVRKLIRAQLLITAGFSEGKAFACYYNINQTDGTTMACSLGLVSSDRTIIDDRKEELRSMNAQDVGKLIREAILRYAKDKNTRDIGGPILIRAISEQGTRWLDDAPTPTRWTYIHEFAASYWADEVKLNLLPGVTKEELEATIRLGEEWSKSAGQTH